MRAQGSYGLAKKPDSSQFVSKHPNMHARRPKDSMTLRRVCALAPLILILALFTNLDPLDAQQPDSVLLLQKIDKAEEMVWADFPSEFRKANALYQLASHISCKGCKVRAEYLMGKYCWSDGRYPEATTHLRKAIVLATHAGQMPTVADSEDLLGLVFYYQAYYDSAIYYATRSLNHYKASGNWKEAVKVLNNISQIYHLEGNYEQAIEYMLLMSRTKDEHGILSVDLGALGGMDELLIDTLYYTEEIESARNAVQVQINNGDSANLYKSYLSLSNAYLQLKNYAQAAHFIVKTDEILKGLGLMPFWDHTAMVYRQFGKRDSCFYYHRKALSELRKSRQLSVSNTYLSIGDSYYHFQMYDSALYFYRKAQAIDHRLNNRISEAVLHQSIASAYMANGNLVEAIKQVDDGMPLAKEVGLRQEMELCLLAGRLYEKTGNFKMTVENLNRYEDLRDSVNRSETAIRLARMQAQFETQKKENKVNDLTQQNLITEGELKARKIQVVLALCLIILITAALFVFYRLYAAKRKINRQLKMQKDLIELQNAELVRQNKEKAGLLSEVHHRVKNNLQIISSLIHLKSQQATGSTREILDQLSSRIFSFGLIHEKLYQAEGDEIMRLDSYLRELTQHLLDSSTDPDHNINCVMDMDAVSLEIETVLIFGLIHNELVTNSLKHAFIQSRDNTHTLTILLKQQKNILTFSVADNGAGSSGSDGSGFGLRFVNQLVNSKLKATWSTATENGYKTIITLQLPSDE